jgi:hypothetical protein
MKAYLLVLRKAKDIDYGSQSRRIECTSCHHCMAWHAELAHHGVFS